MNIIKNISLITTELDKVIPNNITAIAHRVIVNPVFAECNNLSNNLKSLFLIAHVVKRISGYLYYIVAKGNVCEAKMSRGGRRRKTTTRRRTATRRTAARRRR